MIAVLLGRIAQVAASIAAVRVMTSILSPEAVGAASLALSIVSAFNLVLVNPVWMYMFRRTHDWQREGLLRRRVLRHFTIYLAFVWAVAAMALRVASFLGWDGVRAAGAAAAIAWNVVAMSASLTIPLIVNLLGFLALAALLNAAIDASILIGAVVAVRVAGPSAVSWILGQAAGYLALLAACVPLFLSKTEGGVRAPVGGARFEADAAECARFAAPLAVSVAFFWLQLYGYRFIFERALGSARLGLFFSGYGVGAALVNTVESVLAQCFQPAFYRGVSESGDDMGAVAWSTYASKMLPALLLCVAFTAASATFLAKMLLGPAFQSAARFAVWGALIEALRAALGVVSLSAHARSDTKLLLPANVVGAVVAVGVCAVLIPRLGETGAGLGMTLSFVAAIAFLYRRIKREMPLRVAPRPVIGAGLCSALMLAVSAGVRLFAAPVPTYLGAALGVAAMGVFFAASLAVVLGSWEDLLAIRTAIFT